MSKFSEQQIELQEQKLRNKFAKEKHLQKPFITLELLHIPVWL